VSEPESFAFTLLRDNAVERVAFLHAARAYSLTVTDVPPSVGSAGQLRHAAYVIFHVLSGASGEEPSANHSPSDLNEADTGR
jgi:hypothetical protein